MPDSYRIGVALGILIVAVDSRSRKFLIAMAVVIWATMRG